MGEKLREHQVCLKLSTAEYLMLKDISDKVKMKHTEVLRMLIRMEAEKLLWSYQS